MANKHYFAPLGFLTMDFDLVTVRVGEPDQAVNILVSRKMLSSVSPYFRAAFEGKFKEATTRTITLSDVTEETFRIFLAWAKAQDRDRSEGIIPDISILSPKPAAALAARTPQPGTHPFTTCYSCGKDADAASSDDSDSDDTIDLADSEDTASSAFDQEKYQCCNMTRPQQQSICKNDIWVKHHNASIMSYLILFTFADKYAVDQLRDDIMTAMLGQAKSWNFFPVPYEDLILTAYNHLPSSSAFIHFMVRCTALFWLKEQSEDSAARFQSMWQWHPEFAMEVCKYQTKMLHSSDRDIHVSFIWHNDHFLDSCEFHTHLANDPQQCRERIPKKKHLLVALIEAASADGIAMVKELEEAEPAPSTG
jgi:hypothetical protein